MDKKNHGLGCWCYPWRAGSGDNPHPYVIKADAFAVQENAVSGNAHLEMVLDGRRVRV